jgi:hypothetical protein
MYFLSSAILPSPLCPLPFELSPHFGFWYLDLGLDLGFAFWPFSLTLWDLIGLFGFSCPALLGFSAIPFAFWIWIIGIWHFGFSGFTL